MKRLFYAAILCGVLGAVGTPISKAQISSTGPAGLTRQMPRIYGPYMAASARTRYRQRHKHGSRYTSGRVRRHRH
jgi:hypothetical protein